MTPANEEPVASTISKRPGRFWQRRPRLTGWGLGIVLYAIGAAVGLGLTWWLGGRELAGDAARVGVPPLFAAVLAWGLSERTRQQERSFQIATRRDERIAALDLERRRFQLAVLVECQDALIETSRTAGVCLDLIYAFYTDPDHDPYDAARDPENITPAERAFLDAASVLRQRSLRIGEEDLSATVAQLVTIWTWWIIEAASESEVDRLENATTPFPYGDLRHLEQFRLDVERRIGSSLRTLFPIDRTADATSSSAPQNTL